MSKDVARHLTPVNNHDRKAITNLKILFSNCFIKTFGVYKNKWPQWLIKPGQRFYF